MTVSRFEADAINLLRFLLGRLPASQVRSILHRKVEQPAGVSATALGLIQDTLRKGLVQFLVQAGGWRQDRYLTNGLPRAGHPWQRSPELSLHVTSQPLAFLLWLAAVRPGESRQAWSAPGALTQADQLFFLRAAVALQDFPEDWQALRRSTPFADNPWVWLALPTTLDPSSEPPDFRRLFEDHGPVMLECLQPWLTQQWIEADLTNARENNLDRLLTRGTLQEQALEGFLKATDAMGRRDCARFLLQAVQRRLAAANDPPPAPEEGRKLSDRLRASRAGLSMIQQIETLDRWHREARRSAFYDDDHAAHQHWLSEWEAVDGDALAAKWRRWRQQMDPLASTTP